MGEEELIVSKTYTYFRESISIKSPLCYGKVPNQHCRVYMTIEPLHTQLITDIEEKKCNIDDISSITNHLKSKYEWNINDIKNIWAFGGLPCEKTNVSINCANNLLVSSEIKDYIIEAFIDITYRGILCEEPLRGVRFNLINIMGHDGFSYRGTKHQIKTAFKQAFINAFLSAKPQLFEPYHNICYKFFKIMRVHYILTFKSKMYTYHTSKIQRKYRNYNNTCPFTYL